MVKFTHGEINKAAKGIQLTEDGKGVTLDGGKRFSYHRTTVTIQTEGGMHQYTSQRGVIDTPPGGAKLLPYFRRGSEVFVVLVEQFRIALPGQTSEAPGGQLDDVFVHECMARELKEEAHISVDPGKIKLVFKAFIQPSMMPAKAYGGIVQIEESQLPKELMGGEHQFGEYTVIAIYPLLGLLRARDAGTLCTDLETLLLLDAVAKETGLLLKRYQLSQS